MKIKSNIPNQDVAPYRIRSMRAMPPSEMYRSGLLLVTSGCDWSCTFCNFYNGEPSIRRRSTEDLRGDIDASIPFWLSYVAFATETGKIKSMFLGGSDALVLPTQDLLDVLRYAYSKVPGLESVSCYARTTGVLDKGQDMRELRDRGLVRVYVGLESGDTDVLRQIKKGHRGSVETVTGEQNTEAGKLLKNSGIEVGAMIILGLGGKERSEQHVTSTASILNEIDPEEITLSQLGFGASPLTRQYTKEPEKFLSEREMYIEAIDMIRRLDEDLESEIIITSPPCSNVLVRGKRRKVIKALEEMRDDVRVQIPRCG